MAERTQAHEERCSVFESVDDLVRFIAESPRPLYARFSEGPEHDRTEESVDHETGLLLPGLSVNPLHPPSWWRDRPLTDWVVRQVRAYQHLASEGDERKCWVMTGTVVDRGPDNEPLLIDVVTVGLVPTEVAESCARLASKSRRPEDDDEADGSAPWHATS